LCVESNSIVAAGAVITQNTIVSSGSIWAGVPAKKVKILINLILPAKLVAFLITTLCILAGLRRIDYLFFVESSASCIYHFGIKSFFNHFYNCSIISLNTAGFVLGKDRINFWFVDIPIIF
jgi:hypothetical protein